MESPFSADSHSPFQTPYQVAPPNPFLEGGLSKAFPGKELPSVGNTQLLPSARKSQIMAIEGLRSLAKPEFFQTSTASIEGYKIQSYLGMVSAEVVVPKDILFRNPAPHGELHRLKSAEDELQKVKEIALEELSLRARNMEADGIVGVSLQFSQFDAIVCLCSAVGTAVKLAD